MVTFNLSDSQNSKIFASPPNPTRGAYSPPPFPRPPSCDISRFSFLSGWNVCERFILELWYYHCVVKILEIKNKIDSFHITCLKEIKIMTIEKNFRVTINFYKKVYLLVIACNKKHLLKHGCTSNIHTGENVFCSCYL